PGQTTHRGSHHVRENHLGTAAPVCLRYRGKMRRQSNPLPRPAFLIRIFLMCHTELLQRSSAQDRLLSNRVNTPSGGPTADCPEWDKLLSDHACRSKAGLLHCGGMGFSAKTIRIALATVSMVL